MSLMNQDFTNLYFDWQNYNVCENLNKNGLKVTSCNSLVLKKGMRATVFYFMDRSLKANF